MESTSPNPKIQKLPIDQGTKSFQVPSLLDQSSKFIAKDVEKHCDHYIEAFKTVPLQYLTPVFKRVSFIVLEKFSRSEHYKETIKNMGWRGNSKETEDRYRNLFAVDRENPELSDPHLTLINVYKDGSDELFAIHNGEQEEVVIPRILSRKKKELSLQEGTRAIATEKEFYRFFDIFTQSQLKNIDWNNVFVAGGSVLASLTAFGEFKDPPKNREIRKHFETQGEYANSDIDLFIYGLSAEQATEKVDELFNAISEVIPVDVIVVRTPQAVTFVGQFPFRYIQIILRLYKSPAEILMGFDIDSCTVGYDGSDVYCLPRFYRAASRRYNLVDLDRRSTTYELRLLKYSVRGFEVAVPGFCRELVTRDMKLPGSFHGLAKLLQFEQKDEKLSEANEQPFWRSNQDKRMSEYCSLLKESDSTVKKVEWTRPKGTIGIIESSRAAEFNTLEHSLHDYTTCFIPWGHHWNSKKVAALFNQREMSIHYTDDNSIVNYRRNWVVERDVRSVLFDENLDDKEEEDDDSMITDRVLKNITKRMKWLAVEPGRQYIGSFHPQSGEDWYKDAYEVPAVGPNDAKQVCKYGKNCYRKNSKHLKEFSH